MARRLQHGFGRRRLGIHDSRHPTRPGERETGQRGPGSSARRPAPRQGRRPSSVPAASTSASPGKFTTWRSPLVSTMAAETGERPRRRIRHSTPSASRPIRTVSATVSSPSRVTSTARPPRRATAIAALAAGPPTTVSRDRARYFSGRDGMVRTRNTKSATAMPAIRTSAIASSRTCPAWPSAQRAVHLSAPLAQVAFSSSAHSKVASSASVTGQRPRAAQVPHNRWIPASAGMTKECSASRRAECHSRLRGSDRTGVISVIPAQAGIHRCSSIACAGVRDTPMAGVPAGIPPKAEIHGSAPAPDGIVRVDDYRRALCHHRTDSASVAREAR